MTVKLEKKVVLIYAKKKQKPKSQQIELNRYAPRPFTCYFKLECSNTLRRLLLLYFSVFLVLQ